MIDYKSDVVLNRPVEQAYRLASDVARFDDWTDMTGTHLVTGNDLVVGSQVASTIKMGPLKQAMVFQVTELEANRRLSLKTVSKGALDWDAQYTFEPQGPSSTRMTSAGQQRLNGILKLLEPLMASEVKSGEAKELVRFKELLESRES
jgi:hypothetical protein